MPALEPLSGTRVIARPTALDSARLAPGARMLRFAADDALVVGGDVTVDDPAAITAHDTGWVALRLSESALFEALAPLCAFELRSGLNQGMVAGLPAKVLVEGDESLVIVAAPYAQELMERMA